MTEEVTGEVTGEVTDELTNESNKGRVKTSEKWDEDDETQGNKKGVPKARAAQARQRQELNKDRESVGKNGRR